MFDFSFSLVDETGKKQNKKEENPRKKKKKGDGRDHPLRDRVMDITDMLCNPLNSAFPPSWSRRKRKASRREREVALFPVRDFCVFLLLLFDYFFGAAVWAVCGKSPMAVRLFSFLFIYLPFLFFLLLLLLLVAHSDTLFIIAGGWLRGRRGHQVEKSSSSLFGQQPRTFFAK